MIASLRGRLVAGVRRAGRDRHAARRRDHLRVSQRNFLLDRVDTQLASAVPALEHEITDPSGGYRRLRQGRRRPAPRRRRADRHLRRAAHRDRAPRASSSAPTKRGEKPELPANIPLDEPQTVDTPQGAYRVLAELRPGRHGRRRDPALGHQQDARAAAARRGHRDRRRARADRRLRAGRRAHRPAAAGPHGPHRGGDRRRRPLPSRRDDRPAHRGRPPGHRAEPHARPARGRVRRARGQPGAPAPLHRRRVARAAHAAGEHPRLRRALPHGRRPRARRTSRRRCAGSRTRPRAWACSSRTC